MEEQIWFEYEREKPRPYKRLVISGAITLGLFVAGFKTCTQRAEAYQLPKQEIHYHHKL
ncbi:MAG: hypothetical protein OXR66_04205 [Candidatus Woesearchaeota archaeon]|nr:hypothetical protein [Candidatus Woesearchaeota archaeon]